MTFIFDVKGFDIYKESLIPHIDKIRFLGVQNLDNTLVFINLENAIEVKIEAEEIRIDFADYFYVITPKGVEQFYHQYYHMRS